MNLCMSVSGLKSDLHFQNSIDILCLSMWMKWSMKITHEKEAYEKEKELLDEYQREMEELKKKVKEINRSVPRHLLRTTKTSKCL